MIPDFDGLGLVTRGDDTSWDVISPDNVYRYCLGRFWAHDRPNDLYAMLNPSEARHNTTDPTLRKVCELSKRAGAGGVVLVNRYAYSTPYPSLLCRAARAGVDVVGPHNEAVVVWARSLGSMRTIVATGVVPRDLTEDARDVGAPYPPSDESWGPTALCFGRTKDGYPRHPGRIAYTTPLVRLNAGVAT